MFAYETTVCAFVSAPAVCQRRRHLGAVIGAGVNPLLAQCLQYQ